MQKTLKGEKLEKEEGGESKTHCSTGLPVKKVADAGIKIVHSIIHLHIRGSDLEYRFKSRGSLLDL
eukprot:7154582-Ditylum_brightwellii.AAC.1